MNRACARALAFSSIVFGWGCSTLGPPAAAPVPASDPRVSAYVSALHEAAERRQAVRGVVRLALDDGDQRARSVQRIAAARPARLRVEVLGLLDQILAVLATDGETFQLHQTSPRRFEAGPVSRGLLRRVARIDLAPEAAAPLLLGAPAPAERLRMASAMEWSDGRLAIPFVDTHGGLRERYEFDEDGRLQALHRFREGDRLHWVARFGDYRDLAGESFAHQIALEFPDTKAVAVLTFRRAELNPALPEGIFHLEPPKRVSSAGGEPTR
ncbi:MAG: hypothetical protein MJE66_01100 [Proteobacteria bacterium]|nr:hypothetical protein [Pseudomonadota bacterium]